MNRQSHRRISNGVPRNLRAHVFDSPLGKVFGAVDEDGALVQLYFLGRRNALDAVKTLEASGDAVSWKAEALQPVVTQVVEYFSRERIVFDLPITLIGSGFERMVWNELLRIPYGETVSYGELALRMGRRGAYRAVGMANGSNPIALVVPCHRVIGADGTLTGYGAGIEIKKALLELEGALADGVGCELFESPGLSRRFRPDEPEKTKMFGTNR
jgi:methylated-DNA-[protein]-cysteine S-methyltransferase